MIKTFSQLKNTLLWSFVEVGTAAAGEAVWHIQRLQHYVEADPS